MKPATWPRDDVRSQKVLWIDPPSGRIADATVGNIVDHVRAGDVWVFNDAATLPASLPVKTGSGAHLEARVASFTPEGDVWLVLFGPGDWHTPTEHRPEPEHPRVGTVFEVASLPVTVREISPISQRLVRVSFDGVDRVNVWAAIYRHGRAVQYSYMRADLPLWSVQTRFGSRPWASELPSAARPFTWELLLAMRARGATLAFLTHGAGLSSTGDPDLDRALPLPERYDIPAETAAIVEKARSVGNRIVAVGTSVVRALEGCARDHDGRVVPGSGITALRLGPDSRLAVVSGLFTGVHEAGTSHFELVQAFIPASLANEAFSHAERAGYLGHEFGDSSLILAE